MPQRILGVDLGSWSVKAVLLETGFRGFKVEKAVELPIAPAGETADGEEPPVLAERQALALSELLADEVLRADAQVAAFPGEDAAIRFVWLPFADQRKVDQVIDLLGHVLFHVVRRPLGSRGRQHRRCSRSS